jgi:hypothetical protein
MTGLTFLRLIGRGGPNSQHSLSVVHYPPTHTASTRFRTRSSSFRFGLISIGVARRTSLRPCRSLVGVYVAGWFTVDGARPGAVVITQFTPGQMASPCTAVNRLPLLHD